MDYISTFIKSPLFSFLSLIFCTALPFVALWWRSGSMHIVWERILRLVLGKAEVENDQIRTALKESRDLDIFTFYYRIKVENMSEINAVISWSKNHQISISRLGRIRKWVKINKNGVTIETPPKSYVKKRFCTFAFLIVCIAGILQLDFNTNAYLQMKVSKTWFKTDSDEVKSISSNWVINKNDCKKNRNGLEKISEFTVEEVEFICKALGEEDLKSFVKKAILSQIIIAVIIITAITIFAFVNLFLAKNADEALFLEKKLASS